MRRKPSASNVSDPPSESTTADALLNWQDVRDFHDLPLTHAEVGEVKHEDLEGLANGVRVTRNNSKINNYNESNENSEDLSYSDSDSEVEHLKRKRSKPKKRSIIKKNIKPDDGVVEIISKRVATVTAEILSKIMANISDLKSNISIARFRVKSTLGDKNSQSLKKALFSILTLFMAKCVNEINKSAEGLKVDFSDLLSKHDKLKKSVFVSTKLKKHMKSIPKSKKSTKRTKTSVPLINCETDYDQMLNELALLDEGKKNPCDKDTLRKICPICNEVVETSEDGLKLKDHVAKHLYYDKDKDQILTPSGEPWSEVALSFIRSEIKGEKANGEEQQQNSLIKTEQPIMVTGNSTEERVMNIIESNGIMVKDNNAQVDGSETEIDDLYEENLDHEDSLEKNTENWATVHSSEDKSRSPIHEEEDDSRGEVNPSSNSSQDVSQAPTTVKLRSHSAQQLKAWLSNDDTSCQGSHKINVPSLEPDIKEVVSPLGAGAPSSMDLTTMITMDDFTWSCSLCKAR